jgi:hypothetical protein
MQLYVILKNWKYKICKKISDYLIRVIYKSYSEISYIKKHYNYIRLIFLHSKNKTFFCASDLKQQKSVRIIYVGALCFNEVFSNA